MYIDAHCHLDLPDFDHDRDAVLIRAKRAGVTQFLMAGVDPLGWRRQRALMEHIEGAFWTAGIHPVRCAEMTPSVLKEALEALPLCFQGAGAACGVGETGLDRVFVDRATLPAQRMAFKAHLSLAKTLDLPLVLHVVGAHGACLDLLRSEGIPRRGGMVHSFSGSKEVALDYLRQGLHLSVSGGALRAPGARLREALREIPAHRLMVETDAPDQPIKAGERNEPAALVGIAEALAKIRGCTRAEILRDSAANCAELFGMTPGVEHG